MHETAYTFGYPDTLIKETDHWLILLRPKQLTFGSLIIVIKEDVRKFSDLSNTQVADLKSVYDYIEVQLYPKLEFDKINYLALMMVDPQVHYHVTPRYAQMKTFREVHFEDPGWPKLPDFSAATELSDDLIKQIVRYLQS